MVAFKLVTSILACVALYGSLVSSYPTGAPARACINLNPVGHGPSTAKDAPPYRLEFSSSTYEAGQIIEVTLTGALFKGFLIVGRMEDDDSWKQNIGFFQTPSTSDARLQCLDGKRGNGVTHTNNNVKKSITVSWKAPSEPVGNIVFHFTVVRGGAPNVRVFPSDYFMDLQSEPLRPASGFVGHVLPFQQETRDDTAMEIVVEDEGKVVYKLPSLRKLLRRRQ